LDFCQVLALHDPREIGLPGLALPTHQEIRTANVLEQPAPPVDGLPGFVFSPSSLQVGFSSPVPRDVVG
jgi:hypothetical protein